MPGRRARPRKRRRHRCPCRIGAFAEILVDVGDGRSVGIDPAQVEKMRWNSEPSLTNRQRGVTRGCSTA